MKIVLSIIAALVASANLVSASESLRSRSSSIIDKNMPTSDGLDDLEDALVTILHDAIKNEDTEQLFGSELWDELKEKVCFDIDKKQGEEEKALAGKLLLLFKLKKLLCNDDNGITTSTTSTTTSGETCGVLGDECFSQGVQSNCCDGRFVCVLFAED